MVADDVAFILSLDSLMNDLAQHFNEEELASLPALERSLSTEESKLLADAFVRTKEFVPSRSHPRAPTKPPFSTWVSFLVAPLDNFGDLFRRFPKEEQFTKCA